MKRPFLYFSIPMAMGIILYYFMEINVYLVLSLFTMVLIISIVRLKRDNFIHMYLIILFFLFGILMANFKSQNSQLIQYVDKHMELKGSVVEIRNLSEGEGSYILLANDIKIDGMNKSIGEKVYLKVIGEKQLELGDEILLRGILREPLANTNPGLYNHKLNLLTQNIYTMTTAKDYSITVMGKTSSSIRLKIRKRFIANVEEVFDEYLGKDNSALMKAIVLGKTSYVDGERIDQFRDLGLAHVLAVSGLHISIIAVFFLILFAYIGVNRKISIPLVISILWLYSYIIGNPPSVIRANIMFSLLLIAQLRAEPYDSINTLFFALFIMLIINPFWIFSPGFQLSFIATFFIIYLTPKVREKFYPYRGGFVNSISGILSVQIGLLPVQAYYFNRFPIIGLISNLILIPLISVALVLGVVLIPFSFFSGSIAGAIAIIIDFLLGIYFHISDLLATLPMVLKLPSPSLLGILIYYVLISILFRIIDIGNLNSGIVKTTVFYCLFVILINSLILNLDEGLEINFIDVGQGDSILLNTKNGSYLIDTGGNIFGSFDIGQSILLPYLEKKGIFKLKGVFITHYDGDHCKSLPYLMDNMEIEDIYIGYNRDENQLYREILEKAMEKEVPIKLLEKGDRLKLDNNTHVLALGPDERLLNNPSHSDNDLSMVLLLNYYSRKILFTGDIEKVGEESLIEDMDFSIDFLKVPHHGSKTSSSIELLERTRPRVGFVSVGRNNTFGHPHEEVIERYLHKGIELYRTDELGLITIYLNRNNYEIAPFIKNRLSILYIMEFYSLEIIYLIIHIIISFIIIKYYILQLEEWGEFEIQGIY